MRTTRPVALLPRPEPTGAPTWHVAPRLRPRSSLRNGTLPRAASLTSTPVPRPRGCTDFDHWLSTSRASPDRRPSTPCATARRPRLDRRPSMRHRDPRGGVLRARALRPCTAGSSAQPAPGLDTSPPLCPSLSTSQHHKHQRKRMVSTCLIALPLRP
ncbi:hypothetical protein BS78_04G131200 [Paspalum vaginatum]|nr:hypothetical protein BS78_04G131200 [Paspalum vaginatum]